MHPFVSEPAVSRSPLRSAIALAICILATAILLLPVAIKQEGTGGLFGLAAAAAICLVSAIISEFLGGYLHGHGSPLAALGVSMAFRTVLPLTFCLALAARGHHGQEHLAIICYLLVFYLVTLVVETRFAVRRVTGRSSKLNADLR